MEVGSGVLDMSSLRHYLGPCFIHGGIVLYVECIFVCLSPAILWVVMLTGKGSLSLLWDIRVHVY